MPLRAGSAALRLATPDRARDTPAVAPVDAEQELRARLTAQLTARALNRHEVLPPRFAFEGNRRRAVFRTVLSWTPT